MQEGAVKTAQVKGSALQRSQFHFDQKCAAPTFGPGGAIDHHARGLPRIICMEHLLTR